MKYGEYLETHMVKEWEEYYVSYKKLKKILKILSAQLLTKPPTEWTIGVSLSTPAPTNAAAMPADGDSGSESTGNDAPERVTENDFFKVLEQDMEKLQEFTRAQVMQVRAALKDADQSMKPFEMGVVSELPVGVKEQVDAIGERFLKLEKFVNINFTAFRKILKKHDKNLPNPCSAFYIGRLHQQGWVRGDYSDIILNISRIYSLIRGDAHKEVEKGAAQNFMRKTTKYWVRPEFVTAIKYVVSQRLPVSIFGAAKSDYDARSDAQLVNSVYLDNSQLELYHGRLDKTPGAIAIRLRWYGTGEPTTVFVERKTHRDSWTGEVSVKERFIIKPHEVPLLLMGTFPKATKIAEMRAKGKPEEEIADWDALATEIIQAINSKQLVPTMRSQYMRTAFQIQHDASVRISLDTNLCMIYERDQAVMLGERWYRDPTKAVPEDQITRFPHAVLEVKLEIAEGMSTPPWVKEMLASGMAAEVYKFSKFIHGCAVLMQDDVQAVPYWVDDPSLSLSIAAAKGDALLEPSKERIDANTLYNQLLPTSQAATERRIRAVPPPAAVAQDRALAVQAESRDKEAAADKANKKKQQQMSSVQSGASGGGGGGGAVEETKSEPQLAVGSTKSGGYQSVGGGHDDEDEQDNEIFYRASAQAAGQFCAGNDACWWMGAEVLTADDLPTPAQKVEPKTHYANERTLLHWFHIGVYFTALATSMLAFSTPDPSQPTALTLPEGFALFLCAFACGMIFYAIRTFTRRGEKIRNREQVRWDDPFGPAVLGVCAVSALSVFFIYQLHGLGVF